MAREFDHSGLEHPNLGHPDSWATYPKFRQQFVRKIAPQLGINAGKQVLGEVLEVITGDDATSFVTASDERFTPEGGEINQRLVTIRLDYEIDTPELPENVKDRLKKIRDQINDSDWKNQKDYKKSSKVWHKFRAWIEKEIVRNSVLESAMIYASLHKQDLDKYWNQFVSGGKKEQK